MSPKHSIKSKSHHHRRHSYQPRSIRSIGSSSRSHRGRSRSRSSTRARSSSPLLRSHSRATPSSCFGSHSRSRPRKLRNRDFPIYIPPSEQHTHAIPKIIAEALRQQGQDEALEAGTFHHRLPTPPPEPNPNPNTQGAARTPAPGLKRRPSSSPAAAKARRRRRRRPRPRQQSVTSEHSDPIQPPQPELTPLQPTSPYSFFGIIRAKEKEKREEAAKRKKEEERKRKRKQAQDIKKRRDDDEACQFSKKTPKFPPVEESSIPLPRRSNSAPPPLDRSPVYEGQPQEYPNEEESATASQRRHRNKQQRRKKHHRRSAEQHHRRQKRRSSRYVMRDFFASLRRKLGNFFRLTLPAPAQPPPARLDYSTSPVREPAAPQPFVSEAIAYEQQRRGRKRRTPQMQQQPLPPYFMHGGRSPADSWHSRLSRPRSTKRFSATVESAPGSRAASPRNFPRGPRGGMGMGMGMGPSPGPGVSRFAQHNSGSTISIIARRFMGPFLSEPNSEATTTIDGVGGGVLQRRLSWRSYKLLTTGSRPATPPSSRNVSPEGRGRSKSREELSIPGAYRSSSTSMGLRNLYDASSPDPDRRSRSASPPYRVASPEYGGLAELFATPLRVSSPVSSAYVRLSGSDYGLQRLFATPPAGSGSNSNFGLRRLFGE
ncbi:hypothetical protein F4860DRAFT_105848 [Xylaria cubensis]|nr:hypothetical protein F4860DRAFT_105848 [Xylaria cubensis]